LQAKIGEEMWRKLSRFFIAMCTPLLPPHTKRELHKSYITQKSFAENLPQWWGCECDFLARRLFCAFSDDWRNPVDP
jgi:hypothetical protein